MIIINFPTGWHLIPRIFQLTLLLCLGSVPATGWGRSSNDVQSELKKITEQIRALDQKNTEQKGTLGQLESHLEGLERDIATTAKSRQQLQLQMGNEQEKLESIKSRQQQAEQSLKQHQNLFGSHTRALYRISMQPGHELLNPDSLVLNGRQHKWFGYFHQARLQAMTALKFEHAELARLTTERQQTLEKLSLLEQEIKLETNRLEAKRRQRKETVTKLTKQLKTTRQEISQLKENQQKLNKILRKLQKTLADPAFSVQGKTAFSKLKGKLPWPVKGKHLSEKEGAGLQINVTSSQPVYAISHGRVVYADWLRGFGLLTIIDHGEGYMSLYGHNESLFKQVGDWVDPGTIIGNTGNSGGRAKTGLYFELRHNSNTLSVKKWCKNTG